jgi:cytochrome c2
MPRYELTDGQIDDLIAFLAIRAGGSVDWSDRPDHASPEPVTRPASFDRHCAGCHSLEGRGGVGGPALDGVGSRLTPDFIARWLRDPREIDPDSRMPQPVLTDAERAELESFLVGLKNGRTR